MTREEALKSGFLENKVVYLKLVPKPGALTKDPDHVAYGGFDGSLTSLTIGVDRFNKLIDPFRSDEERKFFEEVTKQNLSVYTPNNEFWTNYTFDIIKDLELIKKGKPLDLSDPNQMLHFLVLSRTLKNTVANGVEEFDRNPFCKYILIEEGYEAKLASVELDENEEIYTFLGEIKNSVSKMRYFLNVYYATKMLATTVPDNVDKEFLHKEIKKIIESSYTKAKDILSKNRDKLDKVAAVLIEKEIALETTNSIVENKESAIKICKYDAFIQKHAKSIEWDWRLIASIIYKESKA